MGAPLILARPRRTPARVARRGGQQQARTRTPRCPAAARIRAAGPATRMLMENPTGSC